MTDYNDPVIDTNWREQIIIEQHQPGPASPPEKFDSVRDDELKANGWGYKGSGFYLDRDYVVAFKGDKYDVDGCRFPDLRDYLEDIVGTNVRYWSPAMPKFDMSYLTPQVQNEALLDRLNEAEIEFSVDRERCYARSHSASTNDIYVMRHGALRRIVDVIVWPKCGADVEIIVKVVSDTGCVIIPIGGNTNVTDATSVPEAEGRCIVSMDMEKMNRLLWVDKDNLSARAEAGITGEKLEKELNKFGCMLGHEPDSHEFSTLGGWISTRASGMKKNRYGNIEDVLLHVSLVTPRGVLEKNSLAPRVSAGPDINQFILGSEGTLGVITEATFKIRRLPECQRYGSVVFPSIEDGLGCLREATKQRCYPASIRLVDNNQFILGQKVKPEEKQLTTLMLRKLKMLLLTKVKGFEPSKICAVTLVFEGSKEETDLQEKTIYRIASKFNGVAAGSENGRYGYFVTFSIAYIRDLVLDYSTLGESFETSVPWPNVLDMCKAVEEYFTNAQARHKICFPLFFSFRVTQIYEHGACVYFYFGFNKRGIEDPLKVYHALSDESRDIVIAHGGSISHHHGIGKIRKKWFPAHVGELGLGVLRAVKKELDPNNVFASGNLYSACASKL